jgi:DNA-directed RNA polymerase specialized sigma24 family protein
VTGPPDDPEAAISAAHRAQDFHAAATYALDAYGHEIITFLFARLRNPSDGQDAFSMFVEDFWKGLPGFEFRCSVRVWMYTLARNASIRVGSAGHRKREVELEPLLRQPVLAVVAHARTETAIHLRTAVKDRLRAFREQLDPDDQTMLILHVDRALPWREVALVMLQAEHADPAALAREAARLRKRFERVKAELKTLARREGLISS